MFITCYMTVWHTDEHTQYQEYLWTLERNLDSLPDLTYYGSDRHHSSMYDISAGSGFTLEVPSGGKTKKGSGSCLNLVSDSGGVTRCKVKKTSHLLGFNDPGEDTLSFYLRVCFTSTIWANYYKWSRVLARVFLNLPSVENVCKGISNLGKEDWERQRKERRQSKAQLVDKSQPIASFVILSFLLSSE